MDTPVDTGPHFIDLEIGRRMRDVRLSRGLSQTDVGRALGVSFQQIQKYERGANRFSASRLLEAANFLGIAPHTLFEGIDGAECRTASTPAVPRAPTPGERIDRLSGPQRRVVLELVGEFERQD